MSLLQSIFGGSSEKPAEKSSVFDKTIDVPEPTLLPPPSSVAMGPPTREEAEEQAPNNKKKKRKRMEQSSSEEPSADEEDTEQDGDSVDQRTIFVGNLPVSTTRKQLAQRFSACGKISSTRIRSVAITGVKLPPHQAGQQDLVKKVCANTRQVDAQRKPCVVGYVVFDSPESVPAALKLNNTMVESRRIRVDHVQPTLDASRSVFCGNLPYHADEVTLQQHFVNGCSFEADDVVGVRIVRDKETFQCKGFGYVLFRDPSCVAKALQMHQTTYLRRDIRVLVCGKRFKGRRGEDKNKASNSKRTFEGRRATPTGALKRVLQKSSEASPKKRRARAERKPKSSNKAVSSSGMKSRRAAAQQKTEKRAKKIEKRIAKGMGKARVKK